MNLKYKKMSKELLDEVNKLKKSGLTRKQIKEKLKISRHMVDRCLTEIKIQNEFTPIDMDRKINKTKDELKFIKKKYDLALKEIDELNQSLALKEALNEVTKTFKIKSVEDETDSESVAFMIASDWHVEEEVDPSTINGLNEYNLEVAKERSENFFRNGLELVRQTGHFTKISTLVLALLGDLISGYIHDELVESNECSPTQATLYVQSLLCSGIDYILENSDLDLMIPCCYGNHGRTTQKKRHATGYKNSFEWMMYNNLQEIYKDNPRVEIIVQNGYHVYVPIFDNFVIRFHHGDNIRYGGGVGGIFIPINKAIAQWNKSIKADLDVIGHFHGFKDGGNVIINGSLIGFNAYATAIKAEYEPPRQAFFLIEKDLGKTIVCPIIVDKDIKKGK
jgi:polyhydroxyalkanoate synthesis regulator phasin